MILSTIDVMGYNQKPKNSEIGKISNRITAQIHQINNLKEFAERISNKGYTWCPAVFNGSRQIRNFVSTQFIALDFDGGVSFSSISERAKEYMLPILFAYETFSGVDMDKFRIVFVLDEIITDIDTFEAVIGMFMMIFHECDKSCKDASRMFFGGKRLIYYNQNEDFVDSQNLVMNFSLYCNDKYKNHYKERIEKFQNDHKGISKNSPFSFNNKTTNGENLPKNHKPYRRDTIDELYKNCRLYKEFADDTE